MVPALLKYIPDAGMLVRFVRTVRLRPHSFISGRSYSTNEYEVAPDSYGVVIVSIRQPGQGGPLYSSQVVTPIGIGWVFTDDLDVVPI
jgi:hypothetical protein